LLQTTNILHSVQVLIPFIFKGRLSETQRFCSLVGCRFGDYTANTFQTTNILYTVQARVLFFKDGLCDTKRFGGLVGFWFAKKTSTVDC